MQAVKVFNNNAVSVVMPDGREAILVGNGLGFGRRPGDVIDKSRVSKVYYVQNELQTKFLKMLDNVTPQVMQAAERISLAAEEQGILLSSKSTISLVDHISFALERVEKGTFLPNLMLSETRMLYPKEYAVGQRALELVRQFCGVQLPEDEAGYIALHLVAGAADGALAYDTVKFVMAVKEIICDTYHCTFEEESLETIRLTVFPMIKLIDDVEKYAKKDYWILNYSNPAAIVSEACRKLRPKARIINICDMPIAIIDVVAAAMGIQNKKEIVYDYFGLNHFGWFTSIQYRGEDLMPKLRAYIKEKQILLPESYLKGMGALTSSASQNRHTKGSWYYVWKGEYEIMENFPEYLPNTYLNYYLQAKEFVEHSDPNHTRANEVEETREKNLFDGIDHYLKTGEVDANTFYAGSHGDWIADLSAALKNDTKARFLIITENRGAIPNMPYDAMVELPAYIGKNGPEVIARDNIPLFQQGLMMQQLNSEKLLVEGCVEGSYEKVLQAFTLNKTVPSMNVAKAILDDMIEANKGYWPELH